MCRNNFIDSSRSSLWNFSRISNRRFFRDVSRSSFRDHSRLLQRFIRHQPRSSNNGTDWSLFWNLSWNSFRDSSFSNFCRNFFKHCSRNSFDFFFWCSFLDPPPLTSSEILLNTRSSFRDSYTKIQARIPPENSGIHPEVSSGFPTEDHSRFSSKISPAVTKGIP